MQFSQLIHGFQVNELINSDLRVFLITLLMHNLYILVHDLYILIHKYYMKSIHTYNPLNSQEYCVCPVKALQSPTNIPLYWSTFCIKTQCRKHQIADQYRGILVGDIIAFIVRFATSAISGRCKTKKKSPTLIGSEASI